MARFTKSEVIARNGSGALLQRILIGFLLLSGLALLVLTRAHHPVVEHMRTKTMALLAPVVQVVNAPVATVRTMVTDWQALLNAHSANAALQEENDRLRHWQSVAVSLARENASLRELARYKPVAKTSYISAKIISSAHTAFSQQLWLNAGAEDGVKPYQPVIDAHGLLGRTLEVSAHASKLMLVTNPNSRIPVLVGTSGTRAIVTGAQDGGLQLLFVPLSHNIKVGDLVMTSDDGGLLPPAIAVGEVEAVEGRKIHVRPMRPGHDAPGYVRVVQYTAPHAGLSAR